MAGLPRSALTKPRPSDPHMSSGLTRLCYRSAKGAEGKKNLEGGGGGGKIKLGRGVSLAIGQIRMGGGGVQGVPTSTTGWLFYNGVSTRHSRLAAGAPPSRQQGVVGERCKLPHRGLGLRPRSFHTLRVKSR